MKCHIALSLVEKNLKITSSLVSKAAWSRTAGEIRVHLPDTLCSSQVYMCAQNVGTSSSPACQSLSTLPPGRPSPRRSTRTVSPNSLKRGDRWRSTPSISIEIWSIGLDNWFKLPVLLISQVCCGKCGNALGHEFLDDGPREGRSRFWIFSCSLAFIPNSESLFRTCSALHTLAPLTHLSVTASPAEKEDVRKGELWRRGRR